MNKSHQSPLRMILLATLAAFSIGSANAEKPEWAGKGKPGKGGKEAVEQGQPAGQQGASVEFRFNDDSRRAINDYYGPRFKAGKCPPGLAKKNNGCMPPGQAKKWAMGQPLPKDVLYYELPNELRVRLPAPPPNHRYVRVATDILLIAVGTSMVIDAIQDIGR